MELWVSIIYFLIGLTIIASEYYNRRIELGWWAFAIIPFLSAAWAPMLVGRLIHHYLWR